MAHQDIPLAPRIANSVIGITYKQPEKLMFNIGAISVITLITTVVGFLGLSSEFLPAVVFIVISLPLFALSVLSLGWVMADAKATQVIHGRITSLHTEKVGNADSRTTAYRIVITDGSGNALMYGLNRRLHRELSEGADVRATVAPRIRWVHDAVPAKR